MVHAAQGGHYPPLVSTSGTRTILVVAALTLLFSALPTASADPRGSSASAPSKLDVNPPSSQAGSALGTATGIVSQLGQRARHGVSDMWRTLPTGLLVVGIVPLWWLFKKAGSSNQAADDSQKQARDKDGAGAGSGLSTLLSKLRRSSDASKDEPGLLQKHSEYRSFTTPGNGITYPNLRVFYRPHPQADKLPSEPSPLPLLVFIHGLGGSIAQFHPLLTSLVNLAPCLAVDLPGCGQSSFAPTSWDVYTTDALVELLSVVVEAYRDGEAGQQCVLIGHSMGTALAASLASKSSPRLTPLVDQTLGLIAICPVASTFTMSQAKWIRRALYIPNFVMALWRRWDRRGGLNSHSLIRYVGTKADLDTRRLQMKFNRQSKTAVWRRMVGGWLPRFESPGMDSGGFHAEPVWAGLNLPIYLVAGEDDALAPPANLEKIATYLGYRLGVDQEDPCEVAAFQNGEMTQHKSGQQPTTRSIREDDGATSRALQGQKRAKRGVSTRKALKTSVLPSPASHAVLYAPATIRTLAGLLSDFLAIHVDRRLSLGWQLQYLSTEGKWDVKNLAKWQAVAPVSRPIGAIFRAMKTLREVDDRHCPDIFVREWGSKIRDVIDISHESPVYDPRGLEKGGIDYHKFPTASKIPPTAEEVKTFIELVDKLLAARFPDASAEAATALDVSDPDTFPSIGVHCHYGFNRTGFFIVCYLVERRGYRLQEALDEFARQRAPGIRHEHFIDTLFVRYCIGLKRAPTL